ncbi:MAG: hypothetical protein M3301_00825 [Chloroflexota bacterium]|nr:hypothetical protein [Chloroflexota bacterium]
MRTFAGGAAYVNGPVYGSMWTRAGSVVNAEGDQRERDDAVLVPATVVGRCDAHLVERALTVQHAGVNDVGYPISGSGTTR